MNTAMLASYCRSLLATCLTALLAIGKVPYEFTAADWSIAANAIWVAFVPVLIRALNPNDAEFGVKSEEQE